MAVIPGYSSAGTQATSGAWEVCYNEQGQAPTGSPIVAAPNGDGSNIQVETWTAHNILSVRCMRLGNSATATGAVMFRINGQNDSIAYLEAGSYCLVRVSQRITKLEVKGAGGLAVWHPAIF